jgi:hypothetical protein
MLKELLKEIRNTNLCTWYLLPITGLNRFSFDGVFLNSYLEKNRMWVIVHVPDINLVPKQYLGHAIRTWSNPRGGYLAYELASYWKDDIQAYVGGKYSKFSDELKALIIEKSGLQYRQETEFGTFITDCRLLALNDHTELRAYLCSELNVTEDSLPEDLLSVPPPESFMDVTEV